MIRSLSVVESLFSSPVCWLSRFLSPLSPLYSVFKRAFSAFPPHLLLLPSEWLFDPFVCAHRVECSKVPESIFPPLFLFIYLFRKPLSLSWCGWVGATAASLPSARAHTHTHILTWCWPWWLQCVSLQEKEWRDAWRQNPAGITCRL